MTDRAITRDDLERAVERGIISRAQMDALLERAPLAEPYTLEPVEPIEAPEAFNAVTVAYYVGAFIVLFGFGWFLVDRWDALGPAGVLAVTLIYAALFLGMAFVLRKHGFSFAAAVATLLAVGMTPLVTWSVLKLTGAWPVQVRGHCEYDVPWALECRGRWMIVELTTILASLVALRTVKYALLMKPVAIALLVLTFHIIEAIFGYTFESTAAGWAVIAAASIILVIAYLVDIRNDSNQDYAFWLYLPGLVAAFIGMQMIWSFDRSLRHALIVVAVVTMAVAVYMRRRTFLFFGAVWFAWYLGFLAFDVLRKMVALPILLATTGIVIILAAVWIQRTYPRLVSKVSDAREGKRRLPGGYALLLTPAILALLMIPQSSTRDREIAVERRHQQRLWATRAARERRAAVKKGTEDSIKRVPPSR